MFLQINKINLSKVHSQQKRRKRVQFKKKILNVSLHLFSFKQSSLNNLQERLLHYTSPLNAIIFLKYQNTVLSKKTIELYVGIRKCSRS